MKTRIIRFLSVLALLLFSFSLTACDELSDAEIETIRELLDINDVSIEELRALELTPEVKDVICDIIADECEKKGVEIDREYLKSMDIDLTALAEYEIDEEALEEFKSNMNWDPEITKEILNNAGVVEEDVNESLKETGLTEDDLLVILEAANDPEAEGIEDILNNPKVRQIGVDLHIEVPEYGINLRDVPVGDIMDAANETARFIEETGIVLKNVGVPVDDLKNYIKPPKIDINSSDVIKALEPVGAVTKEVTSYVDPTIIQDIVEGNDIDVTKLVPVEQYDEIIDEAQGYVDQLIKENVPEDLAKFIGLLLAVDK